MYKRQANVCVPVVTSPRAVAEASGIFNVNVPPSAAGDPDTFTSVPVDPNDRPIVEFTNLLFAIVPATMSPFTIELARFNLPYVIAALHEISPFAIVPSKIFPEVIAPEAIVNAPPPLNVASPLNAVGLKLVPSATIR